MYRSSNTTRVSDEFFSNGGAITAATHSLAAAMSSPNPKPTTAAAAADSDQLPTYNPLSSFAKKERNRFRSAENAIHLIPVLLVLCAIILWFFSSPVDVVNKDDAVVAKIEGSVITTGVDHGNVKTRLQSGLDQENQDSVNQSTETEDNKLLDDDSKKSQ